MASRIHHRPGGSKKTACGRRASRNSSSKLEEVTCEDCKSSHKARQFGGGTNVKNAQNESFRITLDDFRRIVREEIVKEAKINQQEDDYDPAVETDIGDLMLDDDGLIVEPDVRRAIKRYFAAMGLRGKLPKHARFK